MSLEVVLGSFRTSIEVAESGLPDLKRRERRDSSSAMSDWDTSPVAHTVRVTFSRATVPAEVVEDAFGTARAISYLCC